MKVEFGRHILDDLIDRVIIHVLHVSAENFPRDQS